MAFGLEASAQYVKVLGVAGKSAKVTTAGSSSTNTAYVTYPGATVDIFAAGTTTNLPIYSTAQGTVKSNPFTAASDATFDFFVAPGTVYDLRISGVSNGVTISNFTRSGNTAPGIPGYTGVLCIGTNDTVLLTTASANGGTIEIPKGITCASNSLTISTALQIDNGGLLKPLTGQTVTLTGPQNDGVWQKFTNATAGLGTISFAGNKVVTEFYPQWWGAVDGGSDVGAALVAWIAAADTAGAGNLIWGANNFGSSVPLVVGSAASQHKLNIIGVNNVVSKLTWLGSTSAVALTLNVEKYSTVSNLRVENGVAKGTTEGIRLTGNAGTGTQTTGGLLNLVVVDGFHYGLRASNGASSTSSEISYFGFTAQNCDTGVLIDDANALSHNFYNGAFSLNTIGLQLSAGSVSVFGASASFNTTDFKVTGGTFFGLYGVYTEETIGKALDLSDGGAGNTKFTIIGCQLGNGAATPNSHTMVQQSGGKLTLIDCNISGQVVFVQGNANSSISMKDCTVIDPNNTYTTTATPDNMGPGFRLLANSGSGGTFESFGNTQCDGDLNTIVGQWPSGAGFVPVSATGQGFCFMQGKMGSAVASNSAIIPSGDVFHVTGTTSITSITSTNFPAGQKITIIFDGVLTFTNGGNLRLAGNFVTTANDSITLGYDGTSWFEVSRSVN